MLAAEADLDKARRNLQRTRITVPYDGLVRSKRVDVGQFVGAGTQLGVTFSVDTRRNPPAADPGRPGLSEPALLAGC